jgi:hypothetical protein
MLSDAELKRLIALCGRLGSDHDGECASAARMVTRFLTERDLTWEDVLTPSEAPMMVLSVGASDDWSVNSAATDINWQAAARACLASPNGLRGDREIEFLTDILSRGWPTLTAKQEVWLLAICGRCGVPGW